MLEWGLILLIGGFIVGFAAFGFIAFNMFSAGTKNRTVSGIIGGHLGGMAVMALGGLGASIGGILVAIHYLEIFTSSTGG